MIPSIQIIAGSYDRVLHGLTATVKPSPTPPAPTTKTKKSKDTAATPSQPAAESASFADTFLFNAHNSAIRCLALSPPSDPTPAPMSASQLPRTSTRAAAKPLARSPAPILENPKHRDWASTTARCPIPKAMGRPRGHGAAGRAAERRQRLCRAPEQQIMISVSKGERCMRLWNLETGKKSRVLNFERATLAEVGEGRHSTGEARRIVWGTSRGGEEEFAVGFDRDVLVFGMDCVPKCRIMGDVKTKVHEFGYVETDGQGEETVLAVATEDGRILFFSTATEDLTKPAEGKTLPVAKLVAQLGGKEAGVTGRIKDFAVLPVVDEEGKRTFFAVTAGSDGRIRLWRLGATDLSGVGKTPKQVGTLLGAYETQNRITCLEAFIMIPRPLGAEESEYEFESDESEDSEDEE
ncbi:hypothetical protein NEMBOFW57_000226 [Staphylotrichum longicolle]|uniref:Uncharacterized protein n=1 Tax=Staphylotrichum longicolle TaxID=669026 RepID=A0AAD4F3P7_9PEZI|nr:hypothetical protein NEMBOFW57_000226 [Staphylotrichum longicolle]